MLAKLANLRPREKAMLVLAALVVFAVLVRWTVIQPLAMRIKFLDSPGDGAIQQQAQILKLYERAQAGEKATETHYEAIKGLIETASSSSEAQRRIKGEIDSLLSSMGIAYQGLEAVAPKKHEFYEEYDVRVNGFETTMSQLDALLVSVVARRQQPGMLRVTDLTLTHGDQGRVKGAITLSKIVVTEGEATPSAE